MTTNKDYIPHSYAALLSWLINFVNYAVQNIERLSLPAEKMQALQVEINEYQTVNESAEAPNAGKADRLLRKEKSVAVIKSVRNFVNACLRYNEAVTDEDRVKMGLNVPDTTPTPTGVPTTIPSATIDTSILLRLTVHYRDSGSSSRAKPAGVHGCEIRWGILPEPPTVTGDLRYSEFSTRTPYTLAFEENQRGKTVYFRLRWESARGQKGPWGEIVSAIVP
jgi:hypothetical protein